jgi:pyruvate/2-oxoglutarate dehydrogenase complex dihydrolipoamide dehydrogenase (E3) component
MVSMAPTRFDAIVIGTGQAGPSLAARLVKAGMRVAVVERHRFGGTCVNTGCIPTKALVASAHAAFLVRNAAAFGVSREGEVRVDMARVKARKDEIVRRSSQGVEKWMRGLEGAVVLPGHARFLGPREIEVGGERLQAERVFINVGGRAAIPDLPGLSEVPFLTNASMMEIDFLPPHLLVVGGSYVGLEFAQMYRRFGSAVTVVEMNDRLLAREDEDVSRAVREILEGEGVVVRTGARCLAVERRPEGVAIRLGCAEAPREAVGSHLLLAVGRRPNTDDLGLEAAGIATDERAFIRVDEELRTSVPGVWALGDCNGRGAFTHTSYNDYEIVAANLLDGERRRMGDRLPTYGLFVDPPLGRVGATEAEVRSRGRQALVATRPMTRVGRAVEKGETRGFMKVLVDAETKRFLGAAILGVGGDEVVHCVTDLMYADAPVTVLQRAVHIHPTVAELLPTLVGELRPLGEEGGRR